MLASGSALAKFLSTRIRSGNSVRESTPFEWLQALTHQTDHERYDVCRAKNSPMNQGTMYLFTSGLFKDTRKNL